MENSKNRHIGAKILLVLWALYFFVVWILKRMGVGIDSDYLLFTGGVALIVILSVLGIYTFLSRD